MSQWIDITEYATKYGVSVSTLRRRIRARTVAFRMERGKYILEDSEKAMSAAPLFSRNTIVRTPITQSAASAAMFRGFEVGSDDVNLLSQTEMESSRIENKKLKSQVAELETLVRALEAELTRST